MNVIEAAMADYIGLILLIAMLISSRIRRSDSEHDEFRIFTLITILTMIACFVDFLVFVSDGRAGTVYRIINHAGNTICFMANPVFVAAWCLYEDIKLYHSRTRIRKIYRCGFIPAIILVLMALVNAFFPILYYIDEANVYHRLPLSYLYYVVDLGYLIFSIYNLKAYEKKYGRVRFFPIYLMIGPMVLGCGIQACFYGISLIWVSTAVGLTAIYMSFQNEFSYIDTLTGLYNRAYLDYQLEQIVRESKSSALGGIMIDVDYFKKINDTFGHSVGDEALIDVARVLQFGKPEKAVATRFAGDEFILLVKDTNESEMQKIVDNIREELRVFNDTEQRHYKLSLSLGYSLYGPDRDDLDSFLKNMDDNMYEEKNRHHL